MKKLIAYTKLEVTKSTMMRHLRRTGIVTKKAQAAIFLSENHKYERKMACRNWSKKKVNQIIFTDEKHFNLDGPDSVSAVSASNGSVGDGCVIDDEKKDDNENNLASEDFISLSHIVF